MTFRLVLGPIVTAPATFTLHPEPDNGATFLGWPIETADVEIVDLATNQPILRF
jgi:hypothetical protein